MNGYLSPDELASIRSLAADIPALWHASDTPPEDRKEIVRALVERVILTMQGNTEHVRFRVHWVGGSTSEHELCRPVGRYDQMADFPRLRERVESLWNAGQSASQIAEQLNQEDFHPPSGRAKKFDRSLVGSLIYNLGLSKPRRPAIELSTDEWWARDIAAEIGVTLTRFRHWVKRGFVNVRRVGARQQLVIWADEQERNRLCRLRDHPRADRLNPYPEELIGQRHFVIRFRCNPWVDHALCRLGCLLGCMI